MRKNKRTKYSPFNSYKEVGRRIGALRKPTFFALEGGYEGEKNGRDIDQFLSGYEKEK